MAAPTWWGSRATRWARSSCAVPAPAGVGSPDAGSWLGLQGLGVAAAGPGGAAFVLLKRGQDLFGFAFGFLLLALGHDRTGDRLPDEDEAERTAWTSSEA